MTFAQEFQGYRRPDGQVGIRNRLAVIAAMDNVNPVARRIASLVREAIAVTVPFGRGQTGLDKARHDGALAGLGRNPNSARRLWSVLNRIQPGLWQRPLPFPASRWNGWPFSPAAER